MKTSGAAVSAGAEMALASRDAAFDYGARDAGELAVLYREHVRYDAVALLRESITVLQWNGFYTAWVGGV